MSVCCPRSVRFIVFLVAVICSCVHGSFPNNGRSEVARNPYKILGVSKESSSDEVKRSYRSLCLKYHPDKNVHLSQKERDKAEDLFKQVQAANDQIGTSEARQAYELQQQSPFFRSSSPASASSGGGVYRPSPGSNPTFSDFENAFAQAFRARPASTTSFGRSSPFYGFSATDIFSRSSSSGGFASTMMPSMPCIYIQHVPVSLQDMYNGKNGIEIPLEDGIFQRYAATFRGGAAYLLLYQAALYSLPTMRISRWLAAVFFGVVFHCHVPRPTVTQYTVNLKPGYKHGTKLIFRDTEPGVEVIFVLVQGHVHDTYQLLGNDLHVTVPISRIECKEGCTIDIEPLGESESTIEVDVEPGFIERSGQKMTVPGKGWPIRKTGKHGNLIVHFRVNASRIRRRQRKDKNATGTKKRHFWQRR